MDDKIADDPIVVGEVVQVLSGGPRMTVRGRYADGPTVVLQCVWFLETDDGWTGPHTGWFAEKDLARA